MASLGRSLRIQVLLVLALAVSGCGPDWGQRLPPFLLEAFLTPDQQGRLWLESGEPMRAASVFEDRMWKGLALYEAGDWTGAAIALASLETARAQFQYGNALARLERLPEARDAYERALALDPELAEARFNLDWVSRLIALDAKEYEDAGGTGGQLEADKIVFDEEGARGKGEMTAQEARRQGLSEEQMREMWMRRVQTTLGEFLRIKFAYQVQAEGGS